MGRVSLVATLALINAACAVGHAATFTDARATGTDFFWDDNGQFFEGAVNRLAYKD